MTIKIKASHFLFCTSACIWIISFLFPISTWASINQNNDVQLWVSGDVQTKISKKVSFTLANEYRFGNNMSEFYFTYLQGIFSFKWNEWLNIEPGYRQIWRRGASNQSFREVYEPLMNFLFFKKNRWDVRQRISYLFEEDTANRWLYRARIRFLSGLSPLYPYISNEFFILSKNGLRQNRVIIGINPKLTHWLSSDFYYLLRLAKGQTWNYHHIFGIKLIAHF